MHLKRRIAVLDAFRALAILPVLLFHYTYQWGPNSPAGVDLYHFASNVDWFQYGWLGVQFFFIISGFVIFMTVENCANWLEFAVRRVLRIYPPMIACMTITIIVCDLLGPPQFHRNVIEYLVGLSLASSHFRMNWVDGAYWSLLVELKFYIYIALAYFAFKPKWLPYAWVALSATAIVFSFITHTLGDVVFIGTALPFFSLGMASYMHFKKGVFDRDQLILLLCAGATYAAFWYDRPALVHIWTLAMVGAFQLFVAGRLEWLAIRPLTFLGAISYPLYLLHQNIGVTIMYRSAEYLGGNALIMIALAISVVVAAAWLVHVLVEMPSQNVAKRLILLTKRTHSPREGGNSSPALPDRVTRNG